jgi:EAL domain-containing protein (putative c-di-GMP-specific phosphodiesterase class I)
VEQVLALGCTVAIDDVGVGYSSLRNLKQLPVDMLKRVRSLTWRRTRGSFAGHRGWYAALKGAPA